MNDIEADLAIANAKIKRLEQQLDGQIQTEGALLGEIHGLRGEVEMRYPDCEAAL